MPTGHPGTQRGFLQRRHRSASCSAPSRSSPSATSLKLWTRSSAGCCGIGARSGGMVLRFLGTRGPGGIGTGSGRHSAAKPEATPSVCLQARQLRRFVLEPLQRRLLFALEPFLPQRQFVEIHRMTVEIRAIHARELHLSAHRYPARPAHPRAIHHDRVQADNRRNSERPGGLRARLHHRNRPDGHHFADVFMAAQHLCQRMGHEALTPVRAVIRSDD